MLWNFAENIKNISQVSLNILLISADHMTIIW